MTANIAKSQYLYNLRNSPKLEIPHFNSKIKKILRILQRYNSVESITFGCRMPNRVNSSYMINNLTLVRDINFAAVLQKMSRLPIGIRC